MSYGLDPEQGILSCIFSDQKVMAEVVASGLTEKWFYDPRHQVVFLVMQRLYNRASNPSMPAVWGNATNDEKQAMGGMAYYQEVVDAASSPSHWPEFLRQLREAAKKRFLAEVCVRASQQALGEGMVDIEGLRKALTDIDKDDSTGGRGGKQLAQDFIQRVEERMKLNGALPGIPTGFPRLDYLTGGLLNEQFVIAARTSHGKTSMGLCLVHKACLVERIPTLILSAEMTATALVTRLCAMHTSIPARDFKHGTLHEDDLKRIVLFNALIANAPLYIVEDLAMTAAKACAQIRRHAAMGVRMVLVDYLQKLKPFEKNEKRTYEVGGVSEALRSAAIESNVALVTLAQLNREPEKDKGRPPRLSDIKDCGGIEQDADTVGLLTRSFSTSDPSGEQASLYIAKQRDGGLGTIPLLFNAKFTRFETPPDPMAP
jgi:replicative DNA helicase